MKGIHVPYNEIHKEIDGVLYKNCNKHEDIFPYKNSWLPCTRNYYYKSKSSEDGFSGYCIECTKKINKKWQTDNREQWLDINCKQNQIPERKIKMSEAKLDYRESGKQLVWQQNHKDKVQQYNKDRSNKKHKISKREWTACKSYFGNCCAYCGIPIEEHFYTRKGITKQGDFHKEHKDHDGTNDLSNCIPSCGSCNDKKWKFKFEDWYIPDNPVYSQERLDKINKWLNEDYKLYIEN